MNNVLKCIFFTRFLGFVSIHLNAQKPNIVFFLAYDLDWSNSELHGTTSFFETLNILKLADKGVKFTQLDRTI